MEPAIVISHQEYEILKKGFEESPLRKKLETQIKDLKDNLQNKELEFKKILDAEFIERSSYPSWRSGTQTVTYFKKDKTPMWIKKIFN